MDRRLVLSLMPMNWFDIARKAALVWAVPLSEAVERVQAAFFHLRKIGVVEYGATLDDVRKGGRIGAECGLANNPRDLP